MPSKRSNPPVERRTRGRQRRRQWGADQRSAVVPVLSPPAPIRATGAARFALFFTWAAWAAYLVDQVIRLVGADLSFKGIVETAIYVVIVTTLTTCASSFLVARLGYLAQTRTHQRAPRAIIERFFDEHDDDADPLTLTVLVPAYGEEERVVRQTLLTAALQEFLHLRVVLLLDDHPDPSDPAQRARLARLQALPSKVAELLAEPHREHRAALEAFEASLHPQRTISDGEMYDLADRYQAACARLRKLAGSVPIVDHSDQFLASGVIGRLARDLEEVAEALRSAVASGVDISVSRAHQLHRRLVSTFAAELTYFQRKKYASVSHEPNKAMNLNSYIGLMGGRYRVEPTPVGDVLIDAGDGPCDVEVPDSKYVLTLDSDSMLLPEYCLRLVHLMEQPEHERTAVIQTPYSAYPGAATRLERVAGATTDVQHIVHQGLGWYDAAFWVGANAIQRKSALDDIVEHDTSNGFPIKRYISDRTVIEDTESTVDMAAKGWRVVNYPERLSYSATPPDFGALCIQRQRWANGGLLIVPKLFSYVRAERKRGRRKVWLEASLRLNYLASVSYATFALIPLLFYPFDAALFSPLAALTALPYFAATSTDLKRIGYHRTDVFRVYGFNLLLLPVNFSGLVKSLGQAIGGYKIAFARTPKVKSRTIAPLPFVIAPLLVCGFSLWTLWDDIERAQWVHAAFAGLNALMTGYAIGAFIGLRATAVDIVMNLKTWVYAPPKGAKVEGQGFDWATVLYHGTDLGEQPAVAARALTLALSDQAAALPLDDRHSSPTQPVLDLRPGRRPGPDVQPAPRRPAEPGAVDLVAMEAEVPPDRHPVRRPVPPHPHPAEVRPGHHLAELILGGGLAVADGADGTDAPPPPG